MTRNLTAIWLALGLASVGGHGVAAAKIVRHHLREMHAHHQPLRREARTAGQHGAAGKGIDRSGRVERGRASVYGPEFAGRRMADGRRFDPRSNAAASKTLPLGTTARITNLRNGRSAMVRIEDRGPHVPGRIADVTPRSAETLGMKKRDVAPVEVAPTTAPQTDGGVRLGAGARTAEGAAQR